MNYCLDVILGKVENGQCMIKSKLLVQIEGNLVNKLEARILNMNMLNVIRMIVFVISWQHLNKGYILSKTGSPGKIEEKYCLQSSSRLPDR